MTSWQRTPALSQALRGLAAPSCWSHGRAPGTPGCCHPVPHSTSVWPQQWVLLHGALLSQPSGSCDNYKQNPSRQGLNGDHLSLQSSGWKWTRDRDRVHLQRVPPGVGAREMLIFQGTAVPGPRCHCSHTNRSFLKQQGCWGRCWADGGAAELG